MKKLLFIPAVTLMVISSCKPKQNDSSVALPQINVQLTEEEKAGGVMTPEIMWKFSRLGSFALSPDGSTILHTTTLTDLASEKKITSIFSVPSSGGESVQLTTGSSPQWFEGGMKIAFVRDGTLWTMNPDGKDQKSVAGISEFESFKISPAGNMIYYTKRVKLDQTANEKHNLPKAKVRIIDDLMFRHWNYWSDYSYSHIFVASFDGSNVKDARDIMEGQRFESPLSPFFDETEISWSPDGKFIAYTTKRLTGKADAESTNSDIYLYDVITGKEINISEGNGGYDRFPVFSPDGSMIAYQSMSREGYEADLDRIFVYRIMEKQKDWITKDWDFDAESMRWMDNNSIFFACSHLGTKQVFKTDIKSGKVTKLTEGIHNLGPINLESGVMVAQMISMSSAGEICSIDPTSGTVKKITEINKYIYDFIRMGKVEEKYTKTKDSKDLQMWVIYPPDFDPAKKYPALLFCEGGPQSALDQFWSYRWNFQMMAAKGYVIFAPNRRGVAGFGQAWKEQISGDWGGKNIQDYLDATDAMAREPYMDKNRIGAVGASYGGTSVFTLAGVHQGRFKTFIAHAGVFNFVSEYGATEELWFPNFDVGGPYWKNNQSMKFSPHLNVDKWDTPILIITGANDFRIPYTQSLEAFTAARVLGIPARLLFFEEGNHWITQPQDAIIWQREFFEWLNKYLK